MALDAARSTAERRTGRASQTSLAPRASDEGVARGSPPSVARAVCSELVPKPPGNVRASLSGCPSESFLAKVEIWYIFGI